MIKLGDKIRLGIMYGFMALVAYVWIEAILLIQMAYSEQTVKYNGRIQIRQINSANITISQNTNREKTTTKRDNHNEVGNNNGNNSDSKDCCFILMDLRSNLNLKGILIQRLTPEEIILRYLFIKV